MKANNKNQQWFYNNFKRVLASITLVIMLVFVISSCTLKNNYDVSKLIDTQINEVTYTFENQGKWLKLKKLLANDLMSIEELGVIDCRGYDRNSAKLRLIQEVSYNIFNQYYGWYLYQAKDGICVENKALHGSKITTFFLNLEDSKVLLSASKGYHFNKLGLMLPKILSKRTIFWTIKGTPCGDGTGKILKNKSIYTNACEETVYYRHDN